MSSVDSIEKMLYQTEQEYTEKQMLNSHNSSNLSVRPRTPETPDEHQNQQSLLPTQLKSTTPSYQQVSIQKSSLSAVQSLPELSNEMLNSYMTTNSPERPERPQTPAPPVKHQNLQSLLQTQLKSTTPSYQQISIQKSPLSAIQSLPELSNQMLNSCVTTNSPERFERPQTPAPSVEHQNLQSLLQTQQKSTTPSYQQISIQKSPLSAVQSLPELSNQMLNSCMTTNSPARLERPQAPAPPVEHQNLQSLLQTQLKSTTPNYQQVPMFTIKPLSGFSKKTFKWHPCITPVNTRCLYSNYDQHYDNASSLGNRASAGFDSNQMHQIKSLKNVQTAFTATSESSEQSLQLHKNHQAMLQTQSSIVENQNQQSRTFLEPPTVRNQQVPITKTPLPVVESLPDTSKTNYLNVNYSLNTNTLNGRKRGISSRSLAHSIEYRNMNPNGNMDEFNSHAVHPSSVKSFETLTSSQNTCVNVSMQQNKMINYNNINKNVIDRRAPSLSTYDYSEFQLESQTGLRDISQGQSNTNNSNTILQEPSTSSVNMDSKPSTLIASPTAIAADHNYSKRQKQEVQDKEKNEKI